MDVLIIDDDTQFIAKLKKDIYNHFYELNDSNTFHDISKDFSELNTTNEYDYIFIDIDLIHESGIELAKKIKTTNNLSNIVFVTSHSNLVFNALSVQPFFFIRKHQYNQDLQIFFGLVDKQLNANQVLTIKASGEKQLVSIHQITYIEPYDRLLLVHTTHGDYKDSRTLKEFMDEVQAFSFVQIHKSYVVNLKHLLKHSASEITLTGNIELPIGRAYKDSFIQKYEEVLLK